MCNIFLILTGWSGTYICFMQVRHILACLRVSTCMSEGVPACAPLCSWLGMLQFYMHVIVCIIITHDYNFDTNTFIASASSISYSKVALLSLFALMHATYK